MTFSPEYDISTRHLMITQRLRHRRDELGLTQKQVVTRLGRCGLHTTNRALSSLEHGTGLDVAKLPELAAALDCTVTYLIGLTDDPHRWAPDEELTVSARGTARRAPVTRPAPTGRREQASAESAARTRPGAPNGSTTSAVEPPPSALILGADVPDRRISQRSSIRR